MKRKITLTAQGQSSTTKVTIEVSSHKFSGYGRDDTNALAADVTDEIMGALGKKYRPSRIRIG